MSTLSTNGALRQVLRMAVGVESLVVPIESVHEILEVGRLTPMPQSPAFLRGVMNLRGAVVPVIDLAARFGLPQVAVGRRTAIVVVQVPGDEVQENLTAGLLVDAVYEVLDVDLQALEPVPSLGMSLPPEYVAGMLNVSTGYAAMISLAQVLAPSDLAARIGAAQAESD